MTVQAPDAKTNFRNLLSGAFAHRWMEEPAARLRARMLVTSGAMAQDGGLAIETLTEHLSSQDWKELAAEFFLT